MYEFPIKALLKILNVKVTDTLIKSTRYNKLENLLQISEFLKRLNINTCAARVTFEQLIKLPFPFIVSTSYPESPFIIIRSIVHDQIEWFKPLEGWQFQKLEDFNNYYSGTILLLETTKNSGELNYRALRKQELWKQLRTPFLFIGGFIVTMSSVSLLYNSPIYQSWVLLKIAGIIVCSITIAYTLDQENSFVKHFCQIGRANCLSVLNSPAATFWGLISLSEIGLLYFSGGWLSIVIASLGKGDNILNAVYFKLFLLNVLVLPFTLLSIWYQGRVIHSWCVLCLTTMVLLWAEFVIGCEANVCTSEINLLGMYTILIGFVSVSLVWIFVKRLIVNDSIIKNLNSTLISLKKDPNVFSALISRNIPIPIPIPDFHSIHVGNMEAKYTITIVTNPFCMPCVQSYRELMHSIPMLENVNVRVIPFFKESNVQLNQMSLHIMQLQNEDYNVESALNDWFFNDNRVYEQWASKYLIHKRLNNAEQIVDKYLAWQLEANVYHTPTFFVNGYKISDLYQIRDIISILENTNIKMPYHTTHTLT